MKKKITGQIRHQLGIVLQQNCTKQDLQRLRKARYMRQEYRQNTCRFTVTLSKPASRTLTAQAKAAGLTPTAFLRETTLAYLADKRVLKDTEQQLLTEFTYLLRNVANNVNQIAKHSNTYQKLAFGHFLPLKNLLQQLEDAGERTLKNLR